MITILTLSVGQRDPVYQAVTVPDPARIQSNVNIKRYADVAAGRQILAIDYPKQALSVRQPWVHCIQHLGKDFENRSRRLCRPGWYFLHASQLPKQAEYEEQAEFIRSRLSEAVPTYAVMKSYSSDRAGGTVAAFKLGNWHDTDPYEYGRSSKWFRGPFGIKIEAVVPLPFQAGPGKQGMFAWDHARAELE